MKWADALTELLEELNADSALTTALGGAHVYRDGEHSTPQVPAVYWSVINAGLEEAMEPVLTQWDIFAPDIDTALAVETRLRKKLHWPGWRTFNGVSLSSEYEDSRDHPEPDFDVIHRSLDFRHTPVRNRGW